MTLLWLLIIGAVAGWLAGNIMKGGGFGLLGNLIIGIIGSFIGGNLLGLLGMNIGGLVGNLVTAVIGAIVLLYVVRLLKRA